MNTLARQWFLNGGNLQARTLSTCDRLRLPMVVKIGLPRLISFDTITLIEQAAQPALAPMVTL
ncbi:hypothetical protein [Sphingorhabdus sp. YGSMI21]|uniref:hypothetical protein n=1 Tax=Sphingorhabdus sp. YGSMI21 TaxID=2077182 RepID=UPI000C1F241B|nr:hypothetical protein [Sphingorhabdus sp. YGSMI21]ATW04244.1 hypothetical protein CHN51_12405 [Sphingorhabdus sp. YGSMI21]